MQNIKNHIFSIDRSISRTELTKLLTENTNKLHIAHILFTIQL